jgi:3',5'-cyclic-AMP phosphodiesterase
MLIAQITDIHLGFDPDVPDEFNWQRANAVIDALLAMERQPDLLLATGDLTDAGTEKSYADLRALFDRCPFPVWLIPGNHDLRGPMRAAFPEIPEANGFLNYVIPDTGALRIVMLDTLEDGRHGGGFCQTRADWLETTLAAEPTRPTLLVAHHPPVETGLGWMTTHADEPWAKRFGAVVARHPQVVRVVTGHIHRSIVTPWAGTTVVVCPSSAPQVALEPRPITREPDNRPMIVAEPPSFALHLWQDGALISHVGYAGKIPVLARYTAAMQPLVSHLLDEHDDH